MELLLSEIQEDVNWRISEIANIKSIPLRYNLLNSHKETLILYSTPSIYAIWEGFLKNTFELLTKYINELEIDVNSAHEKILTHAIENKCKLGNGRINFDKKINFVELLSNIYSLPLNIEQGIPTESNANYKVTNKILERFNIKKIDVCYKKPLDRLLFFRNKIAHGENSIKVTREDIDEFTILVQNIMYEVIVLIEDNLKNKNYKKNGL